MVALGLAFLVLAGASVVYLVFFSLPASRAEAEDDWEHRLVAMAEDREEALERWLGDLVADAHTLARYPTAQYVLSGRQGPPYPFDPELGPRAHLLELLDRFLATHDAERAVLLDAELQSVVDTDTTDGALPPTLTRLEQGYPISESRVELVPGPRPQVTVAVPVLDRAGAAIGAVVVMMRADAFLFPYLRREPVATRTGETLLVTARGDQAVYLSPLRKRDVAPGTLEVPLDSTGLAGVAAAVGTTGPGEYRDYAGDVVLAVTRPLSGAQWAVVAKADRSEIMADYRSELARVVTAILGLLLGALGVAFGLWRWQRQRLAAAVVRERARFAALLDHASDPILFVDLAGRILEASRSAEAFYGYDRDDLIGEPAEQLRIPEERSEAADHMATALSSGTALVTAQHRTADGTTIPVEISTRRAEIDGRTVLISIVRDLRERLAAEGRYRTLVGSLPDLVARFDPRLRCRFVSPPREGTSPFAVEDPVGRGPGELGLPEELAHRLEDALRRVFREGRTQELEARLPDGDPGRTFDWRLVPESDPEGRIVSAVAIVRETTEKRELEAQLRQSQKMEAVGRLAGGVAHDFNNILTSIQGHAQLALDELAPDDPIATDLEEIGRSAERAASLTRQLLAFSRRQIAQRRTVEVGTIVEDMVPMLRRLIGEHIELRVEIGGGPLAIRADPSQIEQVVMNLAVNARDAMPDGGRLRIGVALETPGDDEPADAPDTGTVQLTVADTGIGMDPETVNRIFEPFFTTKEEEKGTGLGLSTVYGIVDQSDGRIEVESEPGQGTVFRLRFPATEPEETVPAPEPPSQAPEPAEPHGLVLLVEDEAGVRGLARRVLEKEGYQVIEARSGAEALDKAEALAEPPALVLTDMMMPGMNGRELVARLRDRFPGCTVLLMSGYTEDAMIRDRKLDGGIHFIEKPFTPDELRRKVAECLNGSDGEA